MPQSQFALAVARAELAISRRRLLVGVLAVLTLALHLLGTPVDLWVYGVFAAWILGTFASAALLHRARRGRQADAVQMFASCGDALFITAICVGIGGGWWLGMIVFAFVVNFAFAILPRRRARYVAVAAIAGYVALVVAAWAGWLPRIPGNGAPSMLRGNAGLALGVAIFGATTLAAFGVVQYGFVRVMRRSQERYRILLQTAPDIILSANREGTILSANDAARVFASVRREHDSASPAWARRSHGRTSSPGSALVGQPIALLAHEDDREAFARDVASAAEGDSRQRELRMPAAGGELCWFLVSCNPILEDDGVTGVLVVARDITKRKRDEEALRRSEEQLRQAQKMEAIGRLAGGVAHDFNNLLTVIGTYSELLMDGLADGTARREDVEEIYKATVKAAALTNQLLTFSRKQVLQPRLVNLNDTVSGMESLLRRVIDVAVKIDTRLYPNLSTTRADPAQLEQVLLNLAINARDAMPDGGLLRIETDDVFLDAAYAEAHANVKPGPYVLLSVSDTGEGMDEETRARIFEPFFTTKAAGEGTGLGLATVYGIVQQSGGHIEVESEVGFGTNFRIYLPVVAAEEKEEPERPPVPAWISPTVPTPAIGGAAPGEAAPALPRPDGGSETILLVEDGEALREVLQRVLEEFGYTVLVAKDGDDALAVADAHPSRIDLLVTDVVMPQMGGRELALELWGRRPEARVLFMSGYTEDSILQQGLRRSTVGFIGKPFRPEALARKVRAMLNAAAVAAPDRALGDPGEVKTTAAR